MYNTNNGGGGDMIIIIVGFGKALMSFLTLLYIKTTILVSLW